MERLSKDAVNVNGNKADADADADDNVFLTMRKFRKRESDRKLNRHLCSAAQELVSHRAVLIGSPDGAVPLGVVSIGAVFTSSVLPGALSKV